MLFVLVFPPSPPPFFSKMTTTGSEEQVILVALGGASSSGKTTVAKALKLLIPSSVLIHLDDFYFTDSNIPIDPETGYQNWDCPEAIDFDRFRECLQNIRKGVFTSINSIEPSEADLKLLKQEETHFAKEIEDKSHKFGKKRIVFVDGFMLFHDPSIIKLFDIKLFFHAPFDTLKSRREARKGYTTAEGFWVDPPNYFSKIVWPAYVKSHAYLYQGEKVDSNELEQSIVEKYDLVDVDNNDSTSLYALVETSLSSIINHL